MLPDAQLNLVHRCQHIYITRQLAYMQAYAGRFSASLQCSHNKSHLLMRFHYTVGKGCECYNWWGAGPWPWNSKANRPRNIWGQLHSLILSSMHLSTAVCTGTCQVCLWNMTQLIFQVSHACEHYWSASADICCDGLSKQPLFRSAGMRNPIVLLWHLICHSHLWSSQHYQTVIAMIDPSCLTLQSQFLACAKAAYKKWYVRVASILSQP